MLIVYLGLIISVLVLFVLSIIKNKWKALFITEFVGMLGSFIAGIFFNSLQGYGFAPGLTYFGEVVYGILTAIFCLSALIISFIVHFIIKVYENEI